VCASCSPHRITIPRQYIVQPPNNAPSSDDESSFPPQPTLWGGEEVRVCNPCVPDPNLSPPQFPFASPPNQAQPPSYSPGGVFAPFLNSPNSHPAYASQQQQQQHPGYFPSPHPGTRHYRSSSAVVGPHTQPQRYYPPNMFTRPMGANQSRGMPPIHHPGMQYQSGPPVTSSMPPQAQPIPRRQIAEEDECPICREELPSRGPNGEDTEREAHIDTCIRDHMYSTSAPAHSAGVQQPASGRSATSTPGVGTPPGISPGAGPSTPRQRRMTGGRMLVYKATEKDCGEEIECVICLEEFEVGEEMGRLECLCKFHRVSSLISI
jgi:hypothetical protein